MNNYYCKYCKKTLKRKSDKKWIDSYCDFAGKTTRLVIKKSKSTLLTYEEGILLGIKKGERDILKEMRKKTNRMKNTQEMIENEGKDYTRGYNQAIQDIRIHQ